MRTGPEGKGGIETWPELFLLLSFAVKEVGRGDFGPPFPGLLTSFEAVGDLWEGFVPEFVSLGSCVNFFGFNHIFPSGFVAFSESDLGFVTVLGCFSTERGRSESIIKYLIQILKLNYLLFCEFHTRWVRRFR